MVLVKKEKEEKLNIVSYIGLCFFTQHITPSHTDSENSFKCLDRPRKLVHFNVLHWPASNFLEYLG